MILHVTFSDDSNPWLSLAHDRKTIAKQWRRWMKCHPETAQPQATCGEYIAEPAGDGSGFWVWQRGDFFKTSRKYKHLGHALAALERLGGGSR